VRVSLAAPILACVCGCSALIALDHYRQCEGTDECARASGDASDDSIVEGGTDAPLDCMDSGACPPDQPACSTKKCRSVLTLVRGATSNHNCAILSDHTLWCWGANVNGQVGTRQKSPLVKVPTLVDLGPDTARIASASIGSNATCAITFDKAVWCWGDHPSGGSSVIPAQVKLGPNFATSVSVGSVNTCAVSDDFTTWCWGQNTDGQAGCTANDAGCTPSPATTSVPNKLHVGTMPKIDLVTVGGFAVCGRAADGDVLGCFGDNGGGAFGNGSTTPGCCGVSLSPEVSPGSRIIAMEATEHYSCAKNDVAAWYCWGNGTQGGCPIYQNCNIVSTPIKLTLDQINLLAPGWKHACAVMGNNALEVRCWGQDDHGQIGDKTKMVVGQDVMSATHVNVLTGPIDDLAAHRHFTCAIQNGAEWCWGDNEFGTIGDGTIFDRTEPVLVVWP
jgi:alpha-tubulin suppressor-like RCC1 family protein